MLGVMADEPHDVGYVVLGWLEGLGDSGGLRTALVERARQSPGGQLVADVLAHLETA